MVAPALRALMLAADGAGELHGPAVRRGEARHPVCGDHLVLTVEVVGDRIVALAWQARACPASVAVAALAAKVLPGTPVADAAATLATGIAAHGGLARHELHAEAMVLRALATATGAGS